MANKIELLLQTVLKNDRIAKKIEEANLTHEQQIQGLPIFNSMLNDEENKDAEMFASFYVSDTGIVMPTFIPSQKVKDREYLDNVVTNSIYKLNLSNEEFDKASERKKLVNMFVKFTKDDEVHKKGIYVYGEMGVGKTFILTKFAKKLAMHGKKVGFVNVPDLVGKFKQSFGPNNNDRYNQMIKTLQEVEYLFMDDIGAESISTWFRDEVMFSILNYRMDHKLPIFFTSNYSQDNLVKQLQKTPGLKYPDKAKALRLIDRVKATSVEVPLLGKNRRY